MMRFPFDVEPRYLPLLLPLGVAGGRAWVDVDADSVRIRFGLFSWELARSNIAGGRLTGPYRWYRAIGLRLSLTDRGVTFGTTTSGGVCLLLREPVAGPGPLRPVRHPAVTVTVARREQFLSVVMPGQPTSDTRSS